MNTKKQHWGNIFRTKDTVNDVSWYQDYPKTSVDMVLSAGAGKDSAVIDVGSGDSRLVDALLELEFNSLSVLDISGEALEKARTRLGGKAADVTWIESDVLEFDTAERFDVWHDRAAFHFLTRREEVARYVELTGKLIKPGGYLVMATFAVDGPARCSGLDITQYSEDSIKETFKRDFNQVRSIKETHDTPFGTEQNFLWSVFRRVIPSPADLLESSPDKGRLGGVYGGTKPPQSPLSGGS